MLYPIILAGGVGTRLWPISTKGKPKQVYPIFDQETLLQKTWKRLRRGFPARNIFVSTNETLVGEVWKQLSNATQPPLKLRGGAGGVMDSNLIIEPTRRGTAPALALVLLKLHARDPSATFVYINADNYIAKEQEFIRLLRVAERALLKKPDHVVLIGVNPTYPEPGLGYIKMGRPVLEFSMKNAELRMKEDTVFEVERFVEKPDLQTAKAFLKSWRYLWNPTLIVARADHFLGLYKKYLPAMWKRLERISRAIGTPDEQKIIKSEFPKIKAETIDYGILEKEKKMLVLPGNFGWTDVGNWRTVHEVLAGQQDSRTAGQQKRNICKAGKCVSVDSTGNLVYSLSGKLVALAGVKNMILIESENALLLCPKGRAQDVKKLVENLEKKGLKEYL